MLETFSEKPETSGDKNICESCGKQYSCGANMGKCWCFEVELKSETTAELQKNFKNCLCENCLRKVSRELHE